MIAPALMSSGSITWQTPDSILDLVRQVGPIFYDPASHESNPTDARMWSYQDEHLTGWTTGLGGEERPVCGLAAQWPDSGLVFCNPPYGAHLRGDVDPSAPVKKNGEIVGRGVGWAKKMAGFRGEAIYLVPSRTDTAAYHALLRSSDISLLIKGRLRFKGAAGPAPFPSAIFYRGPNWAQFMDVFSPIGTITPGPRLTAALMEGKR